MKWSLSGTPGTGKTAVASLLEEKGYKILRITDLISDFSVGFDKERNSSIIDEDKLNKYILTIKDDMIVEGHISHLLNTEGVIILRCHPNELIKRLEKKKWNAVKIKENLEAEALDIILDKSLEKHTRIWEIDTTNISIEQVVCSVIKVLNENPKPSFGLIDWSEWVINNA